MTAFKRYIGINYSGAETPDANLPSLRVYLAEGDAPPTEVPSPERKYWNWRDIAEWLVDRLHEDVPALIGINHGFSFPRNYFEAHGLAPDWPAFLDDFQHHWQTDADHIYVDFIREGIYGNAAARMGDSRWRRLCDIRAGRQKSVFSLDFAGSVAKATHAGLPWLRFIRQGVGSRVHFWPFDGWQVPAGRSAIVEVYPPLWRDAFPDAGRTRYQHDAYSTAAFLAKADRKGELQKLMQPDLPSPEKALARMEGWILGVANERVGHPQGARQPSRAAAGRQDMGAIPDIVLHRAGTERNDRNVLRCSDCGRQFRADGARQRRCSFCRAVKPRLVN